MMKPLEYICASFLILVSGMMYAQTSECHIFDIDFTIELSASSDITGKAAAVFQDKSFRVSGNEFEAYCDGVSVWTLDLGTKEVYIESVNPDAQAYLGEMSSTLASMTEGDESSFITPDGQQVHIKVNSIKKTARKDISSFRPSYEFDSSWVVTDLR